MKLADLLRHCLQKPPVPKEDTPSDQSQADHSLPADPVNSPAARQEIFEERAAIMEYDGELPREQAEALALEEPVRITEEEKR